MREPMKSLHSGWMRPVAACVGQIEYWLRRSAAMLPMNGQAARLEMTREIFELCGIEQVVETGAFRGATTEWMAQFGKPVFSLEISPVYAAYTSARVKAYANVEVRNTDSVNGIAELARNTPACRLTTFFYLDAHWYDYLPLREELELVFGNFPRAIVMIDDFAVPDDPDYVYDDYGASKALTVELLGEMRYSPYACFLPAARARFETGARRGSIVVACHPELLDALRRAPLLREWPVTARSA